MKVCVKLFASFCCEYCISFFGDWHDLQQKAAESIFDKLRAGVIQGRHKLEDGASDALILLLYFLIALSQGLTETIDSYVSTRDVALVLFATAIDPEVAGERIYAIVQNSDWNDLHPIIRRLYPERKFIGDIDCWGKFSGEFDASLGLGLVKKLGRAGWMDISRGWNKGDSRLCRICF